MYEGTVQFPEGLKQNGDPMNQNLKDVGVWDTQKAEKSESNVTNEMQSVSDDIYKRLNSLPPDAQNAVISGLLTTLYGDRLRDVEAADKALCIAQHNLEGFKKAVTGSE